MGFGITDKERLKAYLTYKYEQWSGDDTVRLKTHSKRYEDDAAFIADFSKNVNPNIMGPDRKSLQSLTETIFPSSGGGKPAAVYYVAQASMGDDPERSQVKVFVPSFAIAKTVAMQNDPVGFKESQASLDRNPGG